MRLGHLAVRSALPLWPAASWASPHVRPVWIGPRDGTKGHFDKRWGVYDGVGVAGRMITPIAVGRHSKALTAGSVTQGFCLSRRRPSHATFAEPWGRCLRQMRSRMRGIASIHDHRTTGICAPERGLKLTPSSDLSRAREWSTVHSADNTAKDGSGRRREGGAARRSDRV